jgi:hypothetical protein
MFLGIGLRLDGLRSTWVMAGLAFLALSLAGAPPTSGSVAKSGIKPSLTSTDWAWLEPLIWVSTVAMALLMLRFLWTLGSVRPGDTRGPVASDGAWLAVLVLVATLPLLLGSPRDWLGGAGALIAAALIALPFALAARLRPELLQPLVGRIPPGDVVILVGPLARALGWLGAVTLRLWLRLVERVSRHLSTLRAGLDRGPDVEHWIGHWSSAGMLWLAVLALLTLAAWAAPLSAGIRV